MFTRIFDRGGKRPFHAYAGYVFLGAYATEKRALWACSEYNAGCAKADLERKRAEADAREASLDHFNQYVAGDR